MQSRTQRVSNPNNVDQLISAVSPHPVHFPVMHQEWQSLTFLHWPYPADLIQSRVPASLRVHTFGGKAWVALTPFRLANLRLPFMPAFPWLGTFPEMNVRTYVIGPDGRPGVWFFTLEADRLVAVLGARALYRLPYRWAKMQVQEESGLVKYRSQRNSWFGKGSASVVIQPGKAMAGSDFDHFLTGRYRLYTKAGSRIAFADIDHEPWQLRSAKVIELNQDVMEHSGVPTPQGEPVVHFSRSLAVRIGRFQLLPEKRRLSGEKRHRI